MDLIFSVGTVRFSCMKNCEKIAKNRAWSNTRIGLRAGGSMPGVDDTGGLTGFTTSHVENRVAATIWSKTVPKRVKTALFFVGAPRVLEQDVVMGL